MEVNVTATVFEEINVEVEFPITSTTGVCSPATYKNGDSSFVQEIDSGSEFIAPNIAVQTLSPGSADGGGSVLPWKISTPPNIDVEVPFVSVFKDKDKVANFRRYAIPGKEIAGPTISIIDSEDTVLASGNSQPRLLSNGNIEYDDFERTLSDIQVSDANGVVGTFPRGSNIVLSPAELVVKSGICYHRPVNSQVNSWDETGTLDNVTDMYDEGWHLRNGVYSYEPPENPVAPALLDYDAAVPFNTLKYNNAFGNKNRFTAADGSQTFPDLYRVDNLTGLGWWGDKHYNISFGQDWKSQLAAAKSATNGGYDDYRACTWNELMTLMLLDDATYGFYFSEVSANTQFLTSTTDPSDLDNYIATFVGKHFYKLAKTTTGRPTLLVRNHFG